MNENTPTPAAVHNPYLIPLAIIIAGIIIGGAVFLRGSNSGTVPAAVVKATNTEIALKAVSGEDHLYGNPNAAVKIVEYSDLECPFCKRFHETVKKIVAEYAKGGQVAWVYRHFPLDQLHSKARQEAHATECVAELGGQAAFWQYMDKIFTVTPSNNGLDLTLLPKMAADLGVDTTKFNECQASGRYKDKIEAQLQDAIRSGGEGTPWTIIVGKNGKKIPINGALPYDEVKLAIEEALKN